VGKADRNRAESTRAKIAAQQAAARRAEARRRAMLAGGSVLLVLILVVVFIVIKANTGTGNAPAAGSSTSGATTGTAAVVAKDIATVPVSALNAVGGGPTSGAGKVVPLTKITAAPITANGKPDVLFIGAEYCPFCAAERWAMAVALSRFGTFSGLSLIHSDSTDNYANTATIDFYKSTYASNYLTFSPVELETVSGQPLQTPSTAQKQLLTTWDVAPYTQEAGAIPFIDLGGKYLLISSQYAPSVLGTVLAPGSTQPGLTWLQIAADLHSPSSPVAQSVLGAANRITAGLCTLTGGQPGSVCTSPGVKAAA
jgi:hypothetical protein